MSAFVVDTNVPIVANGKSIQADPPCVLACVKQLEVIYDRGVIVLDDAMLILREYMSNLSMSGQPGAGDFFMKWVWTVQADTSRCEQVHIRVSSTNPDTFEEIPPDSDFLTFDRSDRKFLAVANASKKNPEIINAVDTDWAEHYEALIRNAIRVKFLCPQHVSGGC